MGPLMHPYRNLPPNAVWKTAVAERSHLEFADIYAKKFDIGPGDRIVTAGSCFAQHIAKRLRSAGFTHMDHEPPPPGFPQNWHAKFGYGLFSARYNNIYTGRQLLQLLRRAVGEFQPREGVWSGGGRFYDAFRPTIEPSGFATLDELQSSRDSHLRAVRRVFTESDVFIFTLGLTEAWASSSDGAVFPLCPGTAAGEFDPARHVFHNFTFQETLADLTAVIEEARSINHGLRFLLTVSPVPLVATASGYHVLAATTYSKSVLRAVAGELTARHAFVDYFPAYELVASPPVRAALFEPGLRNVVESGVDVVMKHFFAEHQTDTGPDRAVGDDSGSDPVCEEILLAHGGR